MNKLQLAKGCRTVVECLPKYDDSSDILIEGVRAAIPIKEWLFASIEKRAELKLELYDTLLRKVKSKVVL